MVKTLGVGFAETTDVPSVGQYYDVHGKIVLCVERTERFLGRQGIYYVFVGAIGEPDVVLSAEDLLFSPVTHLQVKVAA